MNGEMKSENQIRNLLELLHDINGKSIEYIDKKGLDIFEQTYTSPFSVDEDGRPEVFEGNEATATLSNLLMAIRTLEWVLDEGVAYKYVKDEAEAMHFKGKIMYDGDGRAMIPDTSIRAFIAGMEGQY
jgi:hypothetical protein